VTAPQFLGRTAQIVKDVIRLSAIAACGVAACESAVAQVGTGVFPLPPTFSEAVANSSDVQSSNAPGYVTNGVSTASTEYKLADEGTASLTINLGSTDLQQADANVTWEFEIFGPQALQQVPIYVVLSGMGALYVTQPPGSLTLDSASAEIFTTAFGTINQSLSTNGQNLFGINLGGYLQINTPYLISEILGAGSIPDGGTTDLVKASIDPTLGFAPGFDNSAGYTIALSPVPTPLPAAAWLLLGGIGGLALIGCKRTSGNTSRRV
jgi:hypothetical protein